ncbi:MAG: type II toxin-antitoxin system RatA family toxin [Betaproteobacteria bacterium]|nr:type II toxin-antitoxin system RatA family toxin [Betaproteobacteria bacterium]
MAMVEKSVLIGHSAARMYALVADVDAYPQFLPWCSGTEVRQLDAHRAAATLHVNYHGLRLHFTTENQMDAGALIDMKLVNGPFKHLDGYWRFVALSEQACKIEFQLSYELSGKLVEKIAGPVFNHIANTLVEVFVKRALALYGPG